ncbi:hypothetical protein FE257_007828 [Aspergillus nanangensis]|uniref:C2H2-type domain-containing protein n=1 Tax=Aspergillus nanangensis TaxID=2582783 RepID=A0AAD4GZ28_ASPNN|nr:hypothetical protein FE257_007828 [Aspergillus nanangensis]
MQSQLDHTDFVLFPAQSSRNNKMLALDSSRQQQTPFFQNFTMDPALIDPFGFHVDNLNNFGQTPSSSRAPQTSYYDTPPIYADSYPDSNKAVGFPSMPATPPPVPTSESYVPGLSTASGPSIASASSSAIGSPYSGTTHANPESWVDTNHGLGLPAAVMSDLFPNDFTGNTLDSEGIFSHKSTDHFVDPSLIQPMQQQSNLLTPAISFPEHSDFSMMQGGFLPQSPDHHQLQLAENYSSLSQQHSAIPMSSPTLMPSNTFSGPLSIYDRRSSISSVQSRRSQPSPAASGADIEEEGKEKGRCPHPECGRVFRDLKAHMLTHLSERPEKCPIATCEYHTKGFARKYDKNRHTLTHYKGTMVCGFCPGSGSPAEKSFNRADVFKRHLTSVHGVEQTPPNCRKRSPTASSNRSVTTYAQDATGKCSTCSETFNNAQDFYEHLDDCVLRVVQQKEPSEAINQQRLAEVESDEEVKKTMEKHMLLDTAGTVERYDDDDDDDNDSNDASLLRRSGKGALKSTKGASASRAVLGNSAVAKRPTVNKRRNNRDRYPQSWGCPSSSIKTKKRTLCVFDGQRRLWKDEMVLDNDFEVRLKLPQIPGDSREAWITDLDVETLKRAEGVFGATDEERGPWFDEGSTQLMGPSMALPEVPFEGDVQLDEFGL